MLDRSVPISIYLQPVPAGPQPSRPPCWSRCFSTSWPWVCSPPPWPPWPPCGCSPSSWPPCGSRCHLAFPQGGTGSASRETGSAGKPRLRCLGGIFLSCKHFHFMFKDLWASLQIVPKIASCKERAFPKDIVPPPWPKILDTRSRIL